MVERRKISVKISKDGQVSLDVENAKGKECLGWTKALEEALSKNEASVKRDLKNSYFEHNENLDYQKDE